MSTSSVVVGIDLPNERLTYMQTHEDVLIPKRDEEEYAGDLKCEVNVFKATA